MSWGNERRSRKTHRIIGVSSVGFLLFMVITGLLWANARFTYWDAGYKEKVGDVSPAPPLESAQVSLRELFEELKQQTIDLDIEPEEVLLRQDFGRLFFEIRVSGGDTSSVVLIDALTKERLSPISKDLARIIAQQYVSRESSVTHISMESYTPRNTGVALEAIRVTFGAPSDATIILDRHTGRIIEDESPWRQVHFLVKQLHQLNFFGFNKTLLNIPGMLILVMSLSGLWLWGVQTTREHRTRQRMTSQQESVRQTSRNGHGQSISAD